MPSHKNPALSIRALIATLLFLVPALAQTTYVEGTFQAAIWASSGQQNPDLTSPAQAQCPANYPQSCSSIGEAGYCCPAGSTCQYASNQQVGCCSSSTGKCSGSLSGGNAYQPTSQYHPPATTTWQPQPTTQNWNGGGGGAVVGAGNYNPTTTVIQQGGYCTTIIAKGDNLPTTAQARCGTALVIEAGAARAVGRGVLGLVAAQVLGAWVVARRW